MTHHSATEEIAHQSLLDNSGLTITQLQNLLDSVQRPGVDASDIYMQSIHSESWSLEDQQVKTGAYSLNRGFGLRVINGKNTGFACSDDLSLTSFKQAAQTASQAVLNAGQMRCTYQPAPPHKLYTSHNPMDSWNESQKTDLLHRVDATARAADPRVRQVNVDLAANYSVILMLDHHGHVVCDVRPLIRLFVQVVLEDHGRIEEGFSGGGGRLHYDYFLDQQRAENYAREAVRQASVNLQSIAAPAGHMPVVLGAGWSAVLLHEAIGHGLEGDFNRKGSSAFSGRIGERVATSVCTVVDDGTLEHRRGSLNVDDEGVPTQRNILIENGILKGYLQDKLNARLMGTTSTGNGRRESYMHTPLPRMTNTFMLPGKYHPEEIITSVDKGLYIKHLSGGQVDITSGQFVFSTREAYLIEKGKITRPVKGATLIGHGPDVLTKVRMVGNDFSLDEGVGTCGKAGQSVPVGVGQPTLLVDDLTVGGTECG